MVLLLTISEIQGRLSQEVKARRLAMGLTQKGLSIRAGVSLPTLRKFEQRGLISLESFLKLLAVVGGLEDIMEAIKSKPAPFSSIDEVLAADRKKSPKKGWIT